MRGTSWEEPRTPPPPPTPPVVGKMPFSFPHQQGRGWGVGRGPGKKTHRQSDFKDNQNTLYLPEGNTWAQLGAKTNLKSDWGSAFLAPLK